MQHKVKCEQPMAQGEHLQKAINVTEFLMYCHILRQSWLTWVSSFSKKLGESIGSMALVTSGRADGQYPMCWG